MHAPNWRRPFPAVLLIGVILPALTLTGCRGNLRRLFERLDLTPLAVVSPPPHPVELPGVDQPVVRRPELIEPMPEEDDLAVRTRRRAPLVLAPVGPFQPAASGPGVIVGEPAAPHAGTPISAFGAGCGRWLQFTLGGLGELGKTPAWSDLDRDRRELGKRDLCWTPRDAVQLARCAGVTHVAVGSITGNLAHCVLTYRLLAVPAGRLQGAPIRVTGSAAEVVRALPRVAREVAAHLGVRSARIPSGVGASPAELGQLGRLQWLPGTASAAQRRQLRELARRLPLAGLLYFQSSDLREEQRVDDTVRRLMIQAPDHPLVIGEIARLAPRELLEFPAPLARDLEQFPDHLLFVLADVMRRRMTGQTREEAAAAAHLVRCSPRNPDVWLTLAWTVSLAGDQVRRSRSTNQLSLAEQIQLRQIYPQWLRAALQAVRLDPGYGKAWFRVATAACFAGERRLA